MNNDMSRRRLIKLEVPGCRVVMIVGVVKSCIFGSEELVCHTVDISIRRDILNE